VPQDARLIVDVGCGLGAGTRRLQDHFPEAIVIGANISPWQLTQAQRRGVKAPVVMDAAKLAIGSGIADAILAMESAMAFDTRADFLAEACRALRPGGTIVLADMLFNDARTRRALVASRGRTCHRHWTIIVELLANAGSTAIDVQDQYRQFAGAPFAHCMRRAFPELAQGQSPTRSRQSVSHLL
jgi:ubiquinone/menaquinone biosynthesis C-methylase UbiE